MNVGTLLPLDATDGSVAAVEAALESGALGVSVAASDTVTASGTEGLASLARVVAGRDAVLAIRLSGNLDRSMQQVDRLLQIASTTRAAIVIYQPDLTDIKSLAALLGRIREAKARDVPVNVTMTPAAADDHAGRAYWLRDSGASIGSQAAAVRADSLLAGKNVQPRAYDAFAGVFARYVREEKTISLGDAIRRMTGFAAAHFRLEGRGLIRVGYAADLVVFDAQAMRGQATVEQPQQYATGVRHVIVNGVAVIDPSGLTGARPGQAVSGRAKRRTGRSS
jgi:N-acyl-D-aspartate/D-glutamate deacylase